MNVSKRLFCIILSFSIILPLVGCGQTVPTATQTEPVPSEKTQVAVDSYLSIAQGFVDKEDFDSAIAVLEQAKDITDDERIAAMLAQIDSMQGIPLNVKLFTNAEHLKTGRAEIHSVTAYERSNGVVRYTIEYTASAGMHIQLSGGRLGHRFDFETSGFQDKLVFEIGNLDVQELKGTVAVTFGFSDEDYYYLQINTPWQNESACEALPLMEDSLAQYDLTFWHQNELQNAEGNIDRISVADSGENCLFTVVHALPENMDATVTLWSDIPRSHSSRKVFLEVPSATNGSETEFRFEISKETLSQQKAMNISFGSEEAGNYGADFEFPFCIQKTTGSPVGQSAQPGYYVENKLKSGSYEIHDITLQRLNNGYARYTLDMTLSDNMRYAAHLITDMHNPSRNQFISDGYSNGERKQYVLDISEEQLAKSCFLSLYIIADENDQNSFSIRIPHSCLTASTGGRPMGKPVPLNYSVFKNPDEQQIRVCEAQFLNNGYVRYTLTGTFPGNALCRFMDQSDGTIVSGFFATEAEAGEYTFTMDVTEETARESKAFTVFVNMFNDRKMATIAVDNFPITDPELAVVIPKVEVKLIYHKLNIT